MLQEKSGESPTGQDFRRNQKHQAVRHGDETAADKNVSFAIGIVRTNHLLAKFELRQRSAAHGFSVMNESSPASTMQP